MPISDAIAGLQPEITAWRRDFHAHPELLFDVHRTAAIVTEKLFNIEGVGLFTAEALETQDFPSIMAVTLFGAFFIVLFNILVDVAYAYLDPRIRLGTSAT